MIVFNGSEIAAWVGAIIILTVFGCTHTQVEEAMKPTRKKRKASNLRVQRIVADLERTTNLARVRIAYQLSRYRKKQHKELIREVDSLRCFSYRKQGAEDFQRALDELAWFRDDFSRAHVHPCFDYLVPRVER